MRHRGTCAEGVSRALCLLLWWWKITRLGWPSGGRAQARPHNTRRQEGNVFVNTDMKYRSTHSSTLVKKPKCSATHHGSLRKKRVRCNLDTILYIMLAMAMLKCASSVFPKHLFLGGEKG